jgi:hypothetical protein
MENRDIADISKKDKHYSDVTCRKYRNTDGIIFLYLNGRMQDLSVRPKSPNGYLFALGSYINITEVAHVFELFYITVKFMLYLRQKLVWARFWATLSQTHPVTLSHFIIPVS